MRLTLLLVAVMVYSFVIKANARERELKGALAFKNIYGANIIRYSSENVPNYISFVADYAPKQNDVLSWINSNLILNSNYSLQIVQEQTDELGFVHLKISQFLNDLPIDGTMYNVHCKNGYVLSMNGLLYNTDITANFVPNISENTALDIALLKINEKLFKNKENLNGLPAGNLVWLAKNDNLNLCYKFDIYLASPLSHTIQYINAIDGEVLLSVNAIKHIDNSTAITKYSGTQNITTDSIQTYSFVLNDKTRGSGVITKNMNRGVDFSLANNFSDSNNYWNNFNALQDEAATDVHWATEKTYDFLLQKFNRNSIDNNGKKLESFLHFGTNYANAFWDGQRMVYGDGNINSKLKILTSLDICAHEITHGLIQYTCNLSATSNGYQECDALNEGLCDIIATAVENFSKPNTADWIIGKEVTCDSLGVSNNKGIRNMQNPNALQMPQCYMGSYWSSLGEPHQNANPLNNWFYTLVNGNISNDINSLGFDTAIQIVYRALSYYLYPNASYMDARYYTILASSDLYGSCSDITKSVTNAWASVCVGNTYVSNSTISSFTANIFQTCDSSLSVNFANNSINANAYTWDFGDGSFSSQINPNHVFGVGSFNVKLVSNGGSCGIDSLTQNAYIIVGPPNGPITTSANFCSPNAAILTAIPNNINDTIYWYDAPVNGNLLAVGNSFTTPILNTTTTYYAEEKINATQVHVGAQNNLIGASSYATATNRHLNFNCTAPTVLHSVKVYSGNACNRTIELRDATGNIIQTKTVYIPIGEHNVVLDFVIPVGNNLQLGMAFGSNVNLLRNTTGANFPYSSGAITITGTNANAGAGYYCYFYDWILKGNDCYSKRSPATVSIYNGNVNAQITNTGNTINACFPSAVVLNATPGTGLLYQWYKDSIAITGATNSIYSTNITGNYSVEVSFIGCGTPQMSLPKQVVIFSAPNVTIQSNGTTMCDGDSLILNASGANSYLWNNGNNNTSITVNNGGNYYVTGFDNNGCASTSVLFNITVLPKPSINISTVSTQINAGSSAIIIANSSTSNIVWSNGNIGNSIAVSTSGSYYATATDMNGCTNKSNSISISVIPNSIVTNYNSNNTFSQNTNNYSIIANYNENDNNNSINNYFDSDLNSPSINFLGTVINNNNNYETVKNNPETNITVYPVPFSNFITIANPSINKASKAYLYNSFGAIVLEINLKNKIEKINTENLAIGLYILKIQNSSSQIKDIPISKL